MFVRLFVRLSRSSNIQHGLEGSDDTSSAGILIVVITRRRKITSHCCVALMSSWNLNFFFFSRAPHLDTLCFFPIVGKHCEYGDEEMVRRNDARALKNNIDWVDYLPWPRRSRHKVRDGLTLGGGGQCNWPWPTVSHEDSIVICQSDGLLMERSFRFDWTKSFADDDGDRCKRWISKKLFALSIRRHENWIDTIGRTAAVHNRNNMWRAVSKRRKKNENDFRKETTRLSLNKGESSASIHRQRRRQPRDQWLITICLSTYSKRYCMSVQLYICIKKYRSELCNPTKKYNILNLFTDWIPIYRVDRGVMHEGKPRESFTGGTSSSVESSKISLNFNFGVEEALCN